MNDIIQNILGNITDIIEQYNYLIIFVLMTVESSFIPFPSELVMIPAGYLIAKGKLSFSLSLFAGICGSIFGALINYQLARLLGYKFLYKYGKYFFISQQRLVKIQKFFLDHGVISTFSGRLIPGVRQYISFPAGLASMNLNKFVFFTFLGSAIWVAILILLGFVFHNNQLLIEENLRLITLIMFSFIFLLVTIYVFRIKKLKIK